jgi:hypothetical protein
MLAAGFGDVDEATSSGWTIRVDLDEEVAFSKQHWTAIALIHMLA